MKQIVVLSGKGGTGKTSVVGALADLAAQEARIVLADADVDASNLELLLEPTKVEEHDFISGKEAVIDPDECTACGRCAELCRFDAILVGDDTYRVDATACEGCALCFYQCPVEAIAMRDCHAGEWYRSQTVYGMLFHAQLYAGQENSGTLVTMVKQQASLWAAEHGADYVIVDGPPGIGCPVIAACAGAQLAILVTEPTVSGAHDLDRALRTTNHFGVPAAVVINKTDINPTRADEIAEFCREQDVPLLGRVSYDTVVVEAMLQGKPVTVYSDGPLSQQLKSIWSNTTKLLADREG